MKEIVAIYKNNYVFIENSLTSMVESVDLDEYNILVSKSIFTLFPALKATYKINKKLKQSTPLYTQENVDNSYLGMSGSVCWRRPVRPCGRKPWFGSPRSPDVLRRGHPFAWRRPGLW